LGRHVLAAIQLVRLSPESQQVLFGRWTLGTIHSSLPRASAEYRLGF
jgi:hypothetical protein